MRKIFLTFVLSLWCLIALSAARFWVGGTGTWDNAATTHWATTTGGAGGASVPGSGDAVTFDASSGGGTVTPNYNMTVTSITMGAFTGTLDFSANNNSPTLTTFNCSGTGTRTLNMGSGTWTVTGNATTIWTVSVPTNLTFSAGTSSVVFSYSGATGTRNIVAGSISTVIYYNVSVSAGSDIMTMSNLACTGSFSTSGFTGNFNKSTATINIGGSFTVGSGSTWTSTSGTITLSSSGSANITTNSVNVNESITLNGTGTFTLTGALDMSGSVSAALTLTAGTLTTGNFNITAGTFSSNNNNTRALTLGSSTLTLSGVGSVFTINSATGLTLSSGTSTIKLTNASASTKTFVSATGLNYYNLWLTGGGAGLFIIGASNVTTGFNDIKVDAPLTVQVFAGKTITATSLTWTGSAGNINTFQSTSAGTKWTLSMTGTINLDYISLQDSYATGGAKYYATPHSTNVSGNSGWVFLPVGSSGNAFFINN